MKKKLLLFLFISISLVSSAQWKWATNHIKSIGNGESVGDLVATDSYGNIYCTYNYSFAANPFGINSCIIGIDSFTIKGFNDNFLCKLDSMGSLIWAKQMKGLNLMPFSIGDPPGQSEYIKDMLLNESDNAVYILGLFVNSLEFECTTLYGYPDGTIYIAKYDLQGNCIWAKSVACALGGKPESVFQDPSGNICITGSINMQTNFGPSVCPEGGFLAKYEASTGSCLMVKKIFDEWKFMHGSSVQSHSIQVRDSNFYLIGWALDTVVVDTITINSNNYGVILTKFNMSGEAYWSKKLIAHGWAGQSKNFFDDEGNIYLCGIYDTICYIGNDTLRSNAPRDMFIAKFDSNGQQIWVKQMVSDTTIYGRSIFVNADGKFYVYGSFYGKTNLHNHVATASTNEDLFIARYDSSGNSIGVITFGNATGSKIICDQSDNIIIAGEYYNNISFSPFALPGSPYGNAFIAKRNAITGVEETHNSSNTFSIYPNPNKGTFSFNLTDELRISTENHLLVYDIKGAKVANFNNFDLTSTIHLEKLAKGIYAVILLSDTKSYFSKLIIE